MESNYGVSDRTSRRDLTTIKANKNFSKRYILNYRGSTKEYFVTNKESLTSHETLAILNILISSKALGAMELETIISKLLKSMNSEEQMKVKKLLAITPENYVSAAEKAMILPIGKFSDLIIEQKEIYFDYDDGVSKPLKRKDGLPLGLYFNAGHFYILMYLVKEQTNVSYKLEGFKKIIVQRNSIKLNQDIDVSRIIQAEQK